MSATTRVVDFPGAQLRATEVKGDKGLFTNVVINSVLAETATQTLDQVTANGATTTRAISITNARPGLTQTDAALTVSGGVGVNANVVATNLIARVDGSVSDGESVPHKHGLQLFAPGGSSGNASLMAGYDPTADVGYVNASRSGSMRPLCLQTRGSKVGVGTSNPEVPFSVLGNNALSGGPANAIASFRAASSAGVNDAGVVIGSTNGNSPYISDSGSASLGLSFYTQNVKRLQIDSSGRVGISTGTPKSKLHIAGDSLASDSTDPSTNGYAQLEITTSSAAYGSTPGNLHVGYDHRPGTWGCGFLQGSVDWLYTSPIALQPKGGSVGVQTTVPIGNFDIQTTRNATEPNNRIAFGNDSYWNRMYFGTTHPTSANGANTRVYLRAVSNGTSAPSASSTHDTVEMYLAYIGANSGTITSDDRRKFNEVAIENACDTLNKLKPQVYDKHNFEFDEISIDEASNVSTEGYVLFNEKYVKRRVSDHSHKEAGLIAQDVFYDAPELRYLVKLSDDADPDEEKPETSSEDIQDDPDYDAAGWGTESASIDYNSLIAYLVKANQELDARVRELEKKI